MSITDLCEQAAAGALASWDEWALRLYERAKLEQWAVDSDIDWRAIELASIPLPARKALSRIYTHVHAGEVLALVMTARSVAVAPELWVKMFGATQLMDEARHVEFFSRVVAMLGEPTKLSPAMLQLIEELAELQTADEIHLGTQVILEGYAQCLFLEGARLGTRAAERRVRLPAAADPRPLLAAVSEYVGRDESRHVAFGVLYLHHRWANLSARERTRLQERGYRFSCLLEAVIAETQADLKRVGIDVTDLVAKVRRTQLTHFQRIGFDT